MINSELKYRINCDEYKGEKLINKFRFIMALLYMIIVIFFAVFRKIGEIEPIPAYAYIPNVAFLLYSVFLFFYLHKNKILPDAFKYICAAADMTLISVCIWVGCSYPELNPVIAYLSICTLFYIVLIVLGAFRYNARCAIFSGIYAGLTYLVVIILRMDVLEMPFFNAYEYKMTNLFFPLFIEFFRVTGMILAGAITGFACNRRLMLLIKITDARSAALESILKTVEQARCMANAIRNFSNDIFISSKNIFTTANNQAASTHEIESTINENAKIAVDIADKTSSVAAIALKMGNKVSHGFSVLGRNVNQIEEIKKKNEILISGIISLGNKIKKISDVLKAINAITDQTKVIAFNAALEAASAEEREERFLAVSREVNRLTGDIDALTGQVREQISEIQNSSLSLIVSGEESSGRIADGNELIRKLENVFCEIRSGVESTANQVQEITVSANKQQQSSEQIHIAITDVSKGLSDFIHSTETVTSSAEMLTQMVKELDSLLAVGRSGLSDS